jgi:glycosyltransferase involved in cell wall biosynthesis
MNSSSCRLRVLHVVEATTAGVGRHVLDLSVNMHRLGIDVCVACPRVRARARQDVGFVDRLRQAGVSAAIVPMQRSVRPVADLGAYRRLVGLIGRGEYDVVHVHSSKAGVLGRLAAWRAGVPAIVYTPNAFAFVGARNRLFFGLYRAIERWLGQHATHAVVCVSASEMALARREGVAPEERLVLIENAIDASIFGHPEDREAPPMGGETPPLHGLDPDRTIVGFVGRLVVQKGIEYLIEAARLAADRRNDVQFVLVGEGDLDGLARRLIARHRLESRVALAGFRQDIPQVMAALDVFVLPSLYEGLPYTLMEAMAAGRAVIATDVMGNRDLIRPGETGLLVPPRDAHALAEAIVHLLSSPGERERLGQGALAAAQVRPTPAQMTDQVLALYEKILEKVGRRAYVDVGIRA